ncbi:MAG: MMPL family transporter [Deltaproteobacteria bacterium]|nr:MAG: MMPL family transporter [Deltaproteobacteria bacterium]
MKNYIKFLHFARIPLAILFILFFAFCLTQIRLLKLKSDFKELLPETFQSVIDLDRIAARVPGTGSLMVAVEGKNPEQMMRFADDLVKKVKELPAGYVDNVEYNVSDVRKFYENNKYLYMSLADLKELKERLDRRIQKEKLKTTGIFIDLDESNSGFETKDLENKYREKAGNYDNYTKGYFFNKEQDMLVVVLRPPGSATGIEFSKDLVTRIQTLIDEMKPTSYDPSIKVGLTGKFRRVLFEYSALIEDIVSTTGLCVALVGLAVLIYYRRARMVLLMAWAVFNGAAWTFALAKWHIGYLTTQTAFLASIIVGNGINYSLILMARYLEERKAGKNVLDSLQISIPATISGTLASGMTTSLAFATLLITEIKGFSHFGFIGGLGMFLCWVATYTVLPVFMSLTESIWPLVKENENRLTKIDVSIMPFFANNLVRWARPLTGFGIALSLAAVPLIVWFVPRSLEYDFSKLRMKNKGAAVSEEAYWSNKVDDVFGRSSTPAVLATDRIEQVKPLCDEIMRKNLQDPYEKQVVDSCKSIYSYLPEDQDEKLVVLGDLRKLLEDKTLKFLSADQKKELNDFKKNFVNKKLELKDLPEMIVKNFREKNGAVGNLVFVYSSFRVPLWDGKNLIRFAELIRYNKLANGDVITGSGDSAIFADMLKAVTHDGPRATVLAFVVVCLAVAVIFREKRGIYFIIGTLTMGVLWMFGAIALFNIKINFFNFIAIPTTFGIGVDYGCNIYQRYKEEGKGSLPKVLMTTGGAVLLCSITTIIGYMTLIIAKNQALVSFGWIGIIGEVTCLVAALLVVPALVIRFENRKKV